MEEQVRNKQNRCG